MSLISLSVEDCAGGSYLSVAPSAVETEAQFSKNLCGTKQTTLSLRISGIDAPTDGIPLHGLLIISSALRKAVTTDKDEKKSPDL